MGVRYWQGAREFPSACALRVLHGLPAIILIYYGLRCVDGRGGATDHKINYDLQWVISIVRREQFTSGFVGVNPNSKIPCAVDHGAVDSDTAGPQYLFESAAIMVLVHAPHAVHFSIVWLLCGRW